MRDLAIWGGTGHAKVLAEFCEAAGYRVAVLFDRDPRVVSFLDEIPLHHGIEGFRSWRRHNSGAYYFAVAVGGDRGADRLEIHDALMEAGLQPATLIHPRAYVASTASIGAGTQVLVNAAVCAGAVLGRQCIVNTSASVDHECQIGNGVHVAPGANLAGLVQVGDRSFVGTGAVVLPRVRIGRDCVIGAGSVVTKDLPDGAVAWGVPARVRRTKSS